MTSGTPEGAPPAGLKRRVGRGRGSIQTKLLLMLLATSILSAVVVGWFGYRSGTHALREATYARVDEVGDERLKEIQDFVANERGAVLLDSQGVGVDASTAFDKGFADLAGSTTMPAQSQQVTSFYDKTFLPRLEKNTGEDYDASGFVPTGAAARYLQAQYTVHSGDFDQVSHLDDAGDGSAWSKANKRFNPYFRAVGESLGLDDVLLLDRDGNVVYSLYKGVELGTNVVRGDYKGGGLQHVFDDSLRSNSRDHVATADFETYVPSYGAPTMFIASPIGTSKNLSGVLVYEISADKINGVLSGERKPGAFKGLGKTGEAYLVGPDGTMRSDSRELFTHPATFRHDAVEQGASTASVARMVSTRRTMLQLTDHSAAADRAGRGKTGLIEAPDYLGHDTLASYQPADIAGLDWGMVTTIHADEALAPVDDFARHLFLATALVVLLVCAASVLAARVFTAPLFQLVSAVRSVAGGQLGAQVSSSERKDEFGDLGAAFNDMSASLLSKQQLLEAQTAENTRLLGSLMPEPVVERYRGGETDIAAEHEDVSVVFTQVDGLDRWIAGKPADEARALLSELSRSFDEASAESGIEKVRNLGSGYVASSGLVVKRVDHARRVVDFALAVGERLRRFNTQHGASLSVRAGVDSGAVRSGLVGGGDVVYNLWGEAVELAYRLRSTSDAPGVYVTDRVKQRLGGAYTYEPAGTSGDGDDQVAVWKVAAS